MRRVRYGGFGGNEVLELEACDDPLPDGEEVLVAARYVGLNPLDVLQRNGRYPVPHGASPYLPGVEVGGVVLAAGSRVTRWAVGDRVMGLVPEGGLADRVLAHQDHLLAVPDTISDLTAATLPEAVITAYDALTRARVRVGDAVAVRGVNGGVGIAAYHVARAMGAVPLGIARTPETVGRLAALGIEAVTAPEAARAFGERGDADVVIELVGGAFVASDLELIGPGGRIVVVSVAGGDHVPISTMQLLGKRADLMGTVLRPRSGPEKALLIESVRRTTLPLVADGRIVMPVEAVFPAGDVTGAFDRLESSGKVGKVVLDFEVSLD